MKQRSSPVLSPLADEARFRLLVENIGDVLWVQHLAPKRYTYVSPSFERVFGVTTESLQADPALWMRQVHRQDRKAVRLALKDWFDGRSDEYRMEYRITRPDGSTRWIADRGLILGRRDGKPYQVGGIAQDITARASADAASKRLAAVVESSDDAILTLDLHGVIQTWNAGAQAIFGYTAVEIVGQPVSVLRPPEAADDEKVFRRLIRQGRRIEHYETRRRCKDGRIIDISLTMSPLLDSSGRITGFSKISRSITERKLAEQLFVKLNQELEQRVQERTTQLTLSNDALHALIAERERMEEEILHISEREQRRIGQDLHDDLGQQLAGAWMMSAVLLRSLQTDGSTHAEAAQKIVQHLEQSVAKARGLARGLHPVSPEQGGLITALDGLAKRSSEMFRIDCKFSSSCLTELADETVCTHLYRIAQEAVSNAVKHGHATRVTIRMRQTSTHRTLEIRDNGSGITTASQASTGMGLRIMRYRATMIQGEVAVLPASPHGTCVRCTFPLSPISTPSSNGQETQPHRRTSKKTRPRH